MLAIGIAAASLHAEVFTVTNANSSGPGSFVQAADDAFTSEGDALIAFAIPGNGVHKIQINSGVLLRAGTTVDGYTQPGAKPNTLAVGNNAVILIQLDGGGPGSSGSGGLRIVDSDCVIRGLSLTGFTDGRAALAVGNALAYVQGYNRIEGNFIGLEADGVTLNGNDSGISFVSGIGNVVGGLTPATRNVIAGNRTGVSGGGTVVGNYIGTAASGFGQGFGNAVGLLAVGAIGGSEPAAGNVITGNQVGIRASGETIQGNLIGTYADGSPSLGNGIGIDVQRSSGATIGGLQAGEGNVIGFNGTGVRVAGPAPLRRANGHSILSNVFPGGRGLEIDLGADGRTSNDFRDQDYGANDLQNFPVISNVARAGASTAVSGGLNSTPNGSFTLQFFATSSGSRRNQQLLGTRSVTTNSTGDATFEFSFPVGLAQDEFVTATATGPDGSTSEFSPVDGAVQLANLSTRGHVGSGEKILIAGYIAGRDGAPTLLIRGRGPSLGMSNTLDDPQLVVRNRDGSVAASNGNWREADEQRIRDTGLAPTNDREAALILDRFSLDDQITVQLSSETGDSGIGLVELFVIGPSSETRKLHNISTRGNVGTGDEVLIAGTIVTGDAVQRVIVRAIGPDLAAAGIAAPLLDPTLELRDAQGTLLVANDNWRSDQEAEIIATGLSPEDDREAAIVATLLPTSYTAIVRGKGETTGIGLVEIYTVE